MSLVFTPVVLFMKASFLACKGIQWLIAIVLMNLLNLHFEGHPRGRFIMHPRKQYVTYSPIEGDYYQVYTLHFQ